ncbi:HlyD family secretion protein [Roseivirga sp. E12]|uniref:HlyD family secretion protein n=1 Tax=Roseivirga sp. E12 TaxID=2819237 RepID=UPI001ABC328D|nr:HlyD family efflux transporter periplasmic adaptor subunit [Roseivirga sp. E12]MBO3697954.1 HlyD family efflux transporter periplasmic adaptor subunit [Roseivirga sp. E12]
MLNLSDNKNQEIQHQQSVLFKTLGSPKAGKKLARILLTVTFLFFILLFFPWQQNIRGNGSLTAFDPSQRPQSVETAIAGRIDSWNVREGDFVNKGDTILTLTEVKDKFFDPELLERTREQIEAKESSIDSKKDKVASLETQVGALRELLVAKREQAENKLIQAKFKLQSDSIDYEAEKIRYANQQDIYERNLRRKEAGNIALTKIQELESKLQETKMKLASAENTFGASKQEVINARVGISAIESELLDKISKAESDRNNTLAEIADGEGSLAKLQNEYANLTIRNEQYQIIAPQDGYIVRAMKAGIGETIKEGESVAQIMPENPELAVEMYVKAMDVPLIGLDRKVRIQFDGWPALQFSGWPNVSVGTFGGVVRVIDRVNSTGGEYRILVTPDPEDEPWPEQLRIGSGTKGWVMLDNVAVWYEIWRQLNGFPPSLYEAPKDVKQEASAKTK